MSAAPPVHTPTSRALIEWVDARIESLDQDEAHTAQRGALSAFRAVRKELVDRLPYVEADALVLVTPGVSHTSAASILELYDNAREVDIEAA